MRLDISEFMQSAVRVLLVLFCLFCGFLGFLYWLDYQHGENSAKREPMLAEIDWKENGIDPTAQNFRPEVVVLAGTVVEEPGDGKSTSEANTDEFEITMRGYDNYHRAEWGNGRSSRWRIILYSGNFWTDTGMKKTGTGYTRIGMGGGFSSNDWYAVARRLWDGTNFVGAVSESVYRPGVVDEFSEQFLDLKLYGRFKIPHTIRHAGWPDGSLRTYHVEKVTFRTDPSPNWFVQERDRLFRSAPEKEAEFARRLTNFVRER